nr:hypothetical protein [Cupriavidus taiwanensis]
MAIQAQEVLKSRQRISHFTAREAGKPIAQVASRHRARPLDAS